MKATKNISLVPLTLATSAVLLAGLSGCSDRNRDLIEASGVAIDGYLQETNVCVDINGDKECSAGEPKDVSDLDGVYSVGTFKTGPLLVRPILGRTTESLSQGVAGSVVTDDFFLSAPITAKTITPLTTLAQVGIEHGYYADVAAAEIALAAALNLPLDIDISNYDYVAQADASTTVAAEIITSLISEGIQEIKDNVSADLTSDQNALETSVKLLIDPNLGGGVGTSLLTEIGDAVELVVASDVIIADIDVSAVITTVSTTIENDVTIETASDINISILIQAVEDTDTTNETGEATGATGASS
ncbi:MAG: hypothetical protein KUG83_07110 [Gammaproteobacteria bacterium]|nr:hypothetical protein [Gammaproteobacteria bacterium]